MASSLLGENVVVFQRSLNLRFLRLKEGGVLDIARFSLEFFIADRFIYRM